MDTCLLAYAEQAEASAQLEPSALELPSSEQVCGLRQSPTAAIAFPAGGVSLFIPKKIIKDPRPIGQPHSRVRLGPGMPNGACFAYNLERDSRKERIPGTHCHNRFVSFFKSRQCWQTVKNTGSLAMKAADVCLGGAGVLVSNVQAVSQVGTSLSYAFHAGDINQDLCTASSCLDDLMGSTPPERRTLSADDVNSILVQAREELLRLVPESQKAQVVAIVNTPDPLVSSSPTVVCQVLPEKTDSSDTCTESDVWYDCEEDPWYDASAVLCDGWKAYLAAELSDPWTHSVTGLSRPVSGDPDSNTGQPPAEGSLPCVLSPAVAKQVAVLSSKEVQRPEHADRAAPLLEIPQELLFERHPDGGVIDCEECQAARLSSEQKWRVINIVLKVICCIVGFVAMLLILIYFLLWLLYWAGIGDKPPSWWGDDFN